MSDNYAARAALEKWLHDTEIQERTYFTSFDRGIRVCVIVIGWLLFCGAFAIGAAAFDGNVAAAIVAPGLLVASVLCGVWASIIRSRATQRMQFRHTLSAMRKHGE